ncbi:MAG TPA: class I SAM-dependent methyltransferase [Spirochaetia bacterium]|nr:class I SAM-dependent methyltransferase [Spirochaetia bacterium]
MFFLFILKKKGVYMSFIEKSYEKHSLHNCDNLPDFMVSNKLSPNDSHVRELKNITPLIKQFKEAKWLTVGDGRYGCDAYLLNTLGASSITATDINTYTLEIAKEKGFIKQYSCENVEKMSFIDNEFDFTVCKHTYHHFPRPAIAFYEMLRVSSKGIVFVEPIEESVKLFDRLKYFIKSVLRNDKNYLYEVSGNFVYRLSIREIEKMMTALDYDLIAFKKYNSFFFPGFPSCFKILNKPFFIAGILIQNILCHLKLMSWGTGIIICIKEDKDNSISHNLKHNGYKVIKLTKNPYSN